MEVEFGSFKKYVSERGFGFVNRELSSPHKKEVFFHIRNIKKSNQYLANKLNDDKGIGSEYFWYEIEKSDKGDQVFSILNPEKLKEKFSDNFPVLIEKIEKIWLDTNSSLPEWVEYAANDLVGTTFVVDLKVKREALEQIIKTEIDNKRKEAEAKERVREEEQRKLMAEIAGERKIKEDEFKLLVQEIKPLKFTQSKQVSSYIMRNRLGHKYKNISGIVKMEMDGNTWDFNGGFPPKIYAQLCEELGLSNQGTHARVVSFNSFKTLHE